MKPKLSILICSLPSRLKQFSVIEELTRQAQGKPVEIIYLGDNKSMTVGEKRNHLVRMAKGDYVTFVDDDDRVTGDYVKSILEGIGSGADVICFEAMVSGYTPNPKRCKYSLGYSHTEDDSAYYRKPNHLMAWNAFIASGVPFPEISNGEDTAWATQITESHPTGMLTEYQTGKCLYYYDFNSQTTEAQG